MPAYKTSNPGVVWRLQNMAACLRLMEVLDKYPLRNRKQAEYEIWRTALMYNRDTPRGNRWTGKRNWEPMIKAKARLEELKVYQAQDW